MDEKNSRTRQLSESSDPGDTKRTKSDVPSSSTSPPRSVDSEKLMNSLRIDTQKMALAHEIAVDNDFKLEKREPPQNSLLAIVRREMNRAYWDVLKEDMGKDPPVLTMVMKLCQSIRDTLLDCLLPQQEHLAKHISNLFDLELIQQRCEAEKSCDPIKDYAPALLDLMKRLCCPIRDEEIERLRTVEDTIELFKGIMEVLEKMRWDFANALLEQIRPVVKQTIVGYEKEKLDQVENARKILGIASSSARTKIWLKRSYDLLSTLNTEAELGADWKPSFGLILMNAYLYTVFQEEYINEEWQLPETLDVDTKRIYNLQQTYLIVSLTAAILIITQGYGASPSDTELKKQIKDCCIIILKEAQCNVESELREALNELATKLFQDLQKVTGGKLSGQQEAMFRSQIMELEKMNHPVRNVLTKRMIDFVKDIANGSKKVQIPPGLSSLETELTKLAADFLKVITLNRDTHAEKYTLLLKEIQESK